MSAPRVFTTEQVAFLREHAADMSTRDLAAAYSAQYEPIGQTMIRRVMARHGIRTEHKMNTFTPIGTERYSAYYDCIMVKTGDAHVYGLQDGQTRDRIRNANWSLKQNVVWEATNGRKLPRKWVVVFLDHDRLNYEPSNLYAVPLQVAGTVSRLHMESEDPEIYKTALIWGQLFFELKKQTKRVQI